MVPTLMSQTYFFCLSTLSAEIIYNNALQTLLLLDHSIGAIHMLPYTYALQGKRQDMEEI